MSKELNLYLVSQTENQDYEAFSAFIVAAESEEEAKSFDPYGGKMDWTAWNWHWCLTEKAVKVKLIGKAAKEQASEVILASSHTGYI